MKNTFKKFASACILSAMILQCMPPAFKNVQAATDTTSAPGWSVEISGVDGGVILMQKKKQAAKIQ